MGKIIKKEIFLDDLPRGRFGKGQVDGVIDWTLSIGHKVKFICDDIEGWLEIVDYKDRYLYIKYLDNPILKILTGNFQNCKIGNIIGTKTTKFKVEIGQIFKDNNRNITITDREYKIRNKSNGYVQNEKWYKYTCNKCGWTEGWIGEDNLIGSKSNGCACCKGFIVVEHINSIVAKEKTHWMIPYFQGGYDEAKLYTYCSDKKIYPICPDCGRVKDKTVLISNIYRNHSIGCSCSDGYSMPNKTMYNILEQLKMNYTTEYSPKWLNSRSYDFYIPSINLIIEMDGEWHKIDNRMSGQTKEESKAIDDYKDLKAREHDVEVIRIDCEKSELEFIKQNILNSKLSELFDLSKIDWSKCEEFTLSNLAKEACDYWNSGIHSTKEIANLMKFDRNTITRYLKNGSKVWGWCDYNPKEEYLKGVRKLGKTGKQVICLENGKIYRSATELERQSESMFGVKLNQGKISAVCNGKRNHHHGYHFKFVSDLPIEQQ